MSRSTRPLSSGSAVRMSPSWAVTRSACPLASMLRRAHARAAGSISTVCTLERGTSWAMEIAMAPEPVPRSTTRGSATSMERRVSIAQSTMISVSGLGTKTPGPTWSSR